MSAKRTSLLAAAALCGVLATPGACWAQAYGASQIVEHNDLRWFEPIELDIDGQMPRDTAGFFFSIDKTAWYTSNPRVEIGQEGAVVDSERIYPAPSNQLAIFALEQTEGLGFITDVNDALSYSGIVFVVNDGMGTDTRTDDTQTLFDITGLNTVSDLEAAIEAFNTDQNNIDNDMQVIVGGEPRPYEVENSIKDAIPDAGFAWGERYEFGYTDGEQGWRLTILDGPESTVDNTWGGGPGALYFSQSGQDFYGPDEFFLGDLEDDDEDGIGDADGEGDTADIWAFGFGSVAVNFELPNEDYLVGFRDYYDNSVGARSGTTSGPLMYVGNYGASFTDITTVDITESASQASIDVDEALLALDVYSGEALDPPPDPASATVLDTQIDLILAELTAARTQYIELEDEDVIFLDVFLTAAIADLADLQAAQDAVTTGDDVTVDVLDPEIDALEDSLNALNFQLAQIVLTIEDGDATDVELQEGQRVADDLDGNGQAGTYTVLADIDGDGAIDPDEVVGIINNYGDLFTFNVFFDEVNVRNTTSISGVELMRTFEVSTRHKLEQGRWDDVQFAYGVRFLDVRDDFYFQGRGSILGRTTAETDVQNQIIGPQIGLKWIRRDGPWDFVLETRGMLGYNIVDVDQEALFGEELIPGALNRPVNGRTTTNVEGARFDEFSPVAELRAMLRYRLAEAVTLQAGYTAKYVANIHRGAYAQSWSIPYFGIEDKTSDIFTNGLNIGIELRH